MGGGWGRGGGSYLQAPMESFNESCELKQQIQGKKIHIYATVWFDSSVTGHSGGAIQDWANLWVLPAGVLPERRAMINITTLNFFQLRVLMDINGVVPP